MFYRLIIIARAQTQYQAYYRLQYKHITFSKYLSEFSSILVLLYIFIRQFIR